MQHQFEVKGMTCGHCEMSVKKALIRLDPKATVEIVALMFQAILAGERIPFSARVWFARLQMPVLRVAIAEPEFFGTLQHPARQLIDRMGACVLGFDGGGAFDSGVKDSGVADSGGGTGGCGDGVW